MMRKHENNDDNQVALYIKDMREKPVPPPPLPRANLMDNPCMNTISVPMHYQVDSVRLEKYQALLNAFNGVMPISNNDMITGETIKFLCWLNQHRDETNRRLVTNLKMQHSGGANMEYRDKTRLWIKSPQKRVAMQSFRELFALNEVMPSATTWIIQHARDEVRWGDQWNIQEKHPKTIPEKLAVESRKRVEEAYKWFDEFGMMIPKNDLMEPPYMEILSEPYGGHVCWYLVTNQRGLGLSYYRRFWTGVSKGIIPAVWQFEPYCPGIGERLRTGAAAKFYNDHQLADQFDL